MPGLLKRSDGSSLFLYAPGGRRGSDHWTGPNAQSRSVVRCGRRVTQESAHATATRRQARAQSSGRRRPRNRGRTAFEREWAVGAAMTIGQVLRYGRETLHVLLSRTPQVPARSERPVRERAVLDPLTARERDVAMLLVRGCTNRDIASSLCMAPSTAERHWPTSWPNSASARVPRSRCGWFSRSLKS